MSRVPASRRWILDGLALSAIVIVTVFSSLRQEDIRFWDESFYLQRGLTLGFGSQPTWEWNPLFTDMYWLLGRVFSDPIDLYFAGRATTAVLIVVAVWMSLRMFTRPSIAFTGALVMSALPITYVWPGVSSPSAGFLLLALAITWRWRSLPAYVGSTALTWLAAATRPEFVWAASAVTVTVVMVIVWRFARGRLRGSLALGLVLGLFVTPLTLTVAYGNPVDLGTRSWEAFEQHYELRFASADDDPWQIDADVIGRDFPGASSVLQAATTNTPAFLAHMGKNFTTLPVSAGGHFMGLGGDSTAQNAVGIASALLWVSALIVAAFQSPSHTRNLVRRTQNMLTTRSSTSAVILSIILIGATFISTLIIYPRPHYLVFAVATSVVVFGLVIDQLASRRLRRWLPTGAILVVSAAGFIFSALVVIQGDTEKKIYRDSLRTMNGSSSTWVLLTPERPIEIYLTDGKQILNPDMNVTTFAELLKASGVNAVFDGILFRQAEYADLDGFDDFIEDPRSFGFLPIIPGSPFLVKN